MKKLIQLLSIIVFFFTIFGVAQNEGNPFINDSLITKTFEELQGLAIANRDNFDKSTMYAGAFLEKSKIEKDTSRIIKGFTFLMYFNDESNLKINYCDSIIRVARKINDNESLGFGYLQKGAIYFEKRAFDKALDNYLEAKKYAKNKSKANFILDYDIGVLKSLLGEDEEALSIFKKSWEFVNKENYRELDNDNYLTMLFALADNYNRVKKHDSASVFNSLGIKESLLANNVKEYYHFVLNEGVNQYYLKNYTRAYDSITKVLNNNNKNIITKPNLIIAQYYLGEILLKNNKIDSAVFCFKNVDSLITETNAIIPETRQTYELLINYYKEKEDSKNQLKYIKNLLKFDSVLNKDYKYLSKKINQKYDTPRLIKEKENIIFELEDKNKVFSGGLLLTSLLLALSFFGLIYYYRRQSKFKKRFESLINKESDNKIKQVEYNAESIGISDEIVSGILDSLKEFEINKQFLKSNITIGDLSKDFKTNSKYLSKVINTFKGRNFSFYINELRIEYVIEKLKSDRKFRRYTVRAISSEIGFNTTEAFSKAFHKKTGIYPSYFIKRLEKT